MMLAWYDSGAANDRLLFAGFMALMLHAALILGIGFAEERQEPASQSLEITLAQRNDTTADENADFLAQTNQKGSGEEQVSRELSTPVQSPFSATDPREPMPGSDAARELLPLPADTVQAQSSEQHLWSSPAQEHSSESDTQPVDASGEDMTSTDIASLMARLAEQQAAYAKLPRVQRLTTVSARAADEAAYLLDWKQRIEAIGNQNYPLEAKRRRLYGDLRLLVSLRPDGGVAEIRVLQSSGQQVLDDAAKQIVLLAAPYDLFPASLRERIDVLQIIRTWQFRANRLTATE